MNLPRTRTADACTLLRHFSHFLNPSDTPLPSLFTDPFQVGVNVARDFLVVVVAAGASVIVVGVVVSYVAVGGVAVF